MGIASLLISALNVPLNLSSIGSDIMEKSLDAKLAEIRRDPSTKAFILADAKDPDLAFGIASPGPVSPEMETEFQYQSMEDLRQAIRVEVKQGELDIMLMSAATSERLTIKERLFESSHITPAARANDTTDIHVIQGGRYIESPSRPFRTPTIDHIQCGKVDCEPGERVLGANLGLYSVTFNNDLERDLETLKAFNEFRLEAERKGFRYFLEVFDPNVPNAVAPEKLGRFINDMIARTLGGVTERGRPLFLKVVYHGAKAMEELVNYDPSLVPGILGGAAGTTYDAYKLIADAQKYGARVALFGRKILHAEHPLAFIKFLRLIVDGQVSPEEAVRAYHGVLRELRIAPKRSLEEDMQLTSGVFSYGSSATTAAHPTGSGAEKPRAANTSPIPRLPGGEPDFDKMTPEQKLLWNQGERDRVFG